MEQTQDSAPQYPQRPEAPSSIDRKKKGLVALVVVIVLLAVLAVVLLMLQQPGPGPGDQQEQVLTISHVEVTGTTTANVSFEEPTTTPHPVKLRVVLSTPTQSGTYIFPSNLDGVTLLKTSGDNVGTMTYWDPENNEKLDPGDMVILSGLQDGTRHNISFLWDPNDNLLGYKVFHTLPAPPVGQFTLADPTSNTTATITFGSLSKNVEPTDLMIILEKDGTAGSYTFPNNDDWVNLTLVAGTRLGDIMYRDYVNNSYVNQGDELLLSELTPSSDYILSLIWVPTNDVIDSIGFSLLA